MSVLVDSKTFNQMISYKSLTENRAESKKVKFTLLDNIKDFLSDKWNRLKQGTRQAIDMMAFLSAERGFVYASQSYLGDRHNVNERTIRRIAKELEEAGLLYIVYRRHSKGNSKGKPIYLFTQHPYFKHWVELLDLDVQEHVREETSKNTDVPKVEGGKMSSYLSITNKQESNIYNNPLSNSRLVQYITNRVQDSIKQGTKIKYLSSYVDRVVRSLENQAIHNENLRLKRARQQREEQARESFPNYNWLES